MNFIKIASFLIKLVRNLDSLFFLEQDCEISEQNKRLVQENLTSENFDNHSFSCK